MKRDFHVYMKRDTHTYMEKRLSISFHICMKVSFYKYSRSFAVCNMYIRKDAYIHRRFTYIYTYVYGRTLVHTLQKTQGS